MSRSRSTLYLDLRRFDLPIDLGHSSITKEDAASLGELLWTADKGTVDDVGETLEQAIAEMSETLDGKYGPPLLDCSFGIFEGRRPVAASIFVYYPKESMPLLAYTMTHPERQNRGFCQYLVKVSVNALLEKGYERCFLAVTDANAPAVATYEKIGFKRKA